MSTRTAIESGIPRSPSWRPWRTMQQIRHMRTSVMIRKQNTKLHTVMRVSLFGLLIFLPAQAFADECTRGSKIKLDGSLPYHHITNTCAYAIDVRFWADGGLYADKRPEYLIENIGPGETTGVAVQSNYTLYWTWCRRQARAQGKCALRAN